MPIIVLIALVLSVLVTYMLMPAVIRLAEAKKLFDTPNHRKVHVQPIASLGGVAIFAGTILPCLVALRFMDAIYFSCHICAMTIIILFGIQDDLIGISPGKKLLGQALAAIVAVVGGGLTLQPVFDQLHLFTLPIWAGWLFTSLFIVVLINAFNLIDGVDGLAGTLGSIPTIILGFFFYKNGLYAYATLCFCLSGSLLAFLAFNLQPARIFMGDTGSLLVGLVCSIIVVKFIEVAPEAKQFFVTPSVAMGFALVWLPLADMLRVFLERLSTGASPFRADRRHLHHLLLARGIRHQAIAPILLAMTVILIALVYLLNHLAFPYLLLLLSIGYLLIFLAVSYRVRQNSSHTPSLDAGISTTTAAFKEKL